MATPDETTAPAPFDYNSARELSDYFFLDSRRYNTTIKEDA